MRAMRSLLSGMLVVGCLFPPETPAAVPEPSVEQRRAEAEAEAAAREDQARAETTTAPPAPADDADIIVLERIDFPADSTEITESGRSILDSVAKTMKKYPEFTVLEAAGHARLGAEHHALQLSRMRSQAVVAALVERGVEKERLLATAYADYCPLKPEPARDGRNGRVEFKVLFVRDQGPTGVNRGCPAATAAGLPPPELKSPAR